MKMVPNTRPKLEESAVVATLIAWDVSAEQDPCRVLMLPGYYAKSMGPTDGDDFGIYDDAFFVLTPNAFASFNGNTNPSIKREGISWVKPGVHRYKKGIHGLSRPAHKQYEAFRPATPGERLPVWRVENGVWTDSIGVANNIHPGSRGSTSSHGCLTVYPSQWNAFKTLLYSELDRCNQKTFPVCIPGSPNIPPFI